MTRALEINTLSFNAQNNISMTMVQLETFAGIFLFYVFFDTCWIYKKKIWLALAILHIAIYLFLYVTAGEVLYEIFWIGYQEQYYILTQILDILS